MGTCWGFIDTYLTASKPEQNARVLMSNRMEIAHKRLRPLTRFVHDQVERLLRDRPLNWYVLKALPDLVAIAGLNGVHAVASNKANNIVDLEDIFRSITRWITPVPDLRVIAGPQGVEVAGAQIVLGLAHLGPAHIDNICGSAKATYGAP